MRPSRLFAVPAVLAALLGAGCYGSTEPATELGFDSAVLNARGTTQATETFSFFEYWPTAQPDRVEATPRRQWPPRVSGPISARIEGLAPATGYSFRLCGGDADPAAPVCAQVRQFFTPTPAGDLVLGEVENYESFRPLEVNASSGPDGESPNGFISLRGRFAGSVTSVRVEGNRAAVTASGTVFGGGQQFTANGCLEARDGGPVSFRFALVGIDPPIGPCVPPPPGPDGGGAFIVYDTPSGTP